MQKVLCDAIKGMNVVHCTYKGEHREVHPLAIIYNEKHELVLVCWQFAGGSSSGRPMPAWGNFTLADLTDVTVQSETFPDAPPDYKPDHYRNKVCWVPKSRDRKKS